MSALTDRYLAELGKNINTPDTIIELTLDSGVKKFGYGMAFSDVIPCLKSVSAFQNKLDTKNGHGTRGEIKAKIVGRNIFKPLIADNYLKNRPDLRKLMKGFMVESYLKEGSQKLEACNASTIDLNGLSITDPCLGWEQTKALLLTLANEVNS